MSASRRHLRAPGLALAATIGVSAFAALPSAAGAAESARCDATSLQLTLLGGDAITPVRANQAFTPCADDTKALANVPSLLGIAGVQAVTASTKVDTTKQATSESRIAGARVGITGPLSDALTGPLLNGPNSIVGQVDGALNGILGQLTAAGGPLGGLLSGFFPAAGTNGAPITAGLTANLAGALQAALPDVLNADVISATAQAKCVSGKAQLSGASQIAGLRILGTTVDVNDAAGRVLSIDTATLNLGKILSIDDVLRGIKIDLTNSPLRSILEPVLGTGTNLYDILHVNSTHPSVIGALDGLLSTLTFGQLSLGQITTQLTAALQPILNQVNVNLPAGLLRAQIVPKAQTTQGELLTQQTLGVYVSALGQPVVGGILAQARVSSAAAGCSDVAGAGAVKDPEKYASPEAEAVLQCSNRPAQLIDVYGTGGRTYVQGVAIRKYVGKTATIYTRDGNKRVGKAKVRKTGLFSTRVPLPRASIRNTNTARYYAVVGGKKTRALKFARRMKVLGLSTRKGKVTMKGQVVAPRFSTRPTVLIKQRVSCKSYKKVARVKPDARGNFTVTFKAPSKKLGAAIYRAETSVPANTVSTKSFRTYTLPRPVGL